MPDVAAILADVTPDTPIIGDVATAPVVADKAAPIVDAGKPAAKVAAPTLAEGDGSIPADKATAAEAKWRDDWREALANGDDKALTRLKRFASPENVFKSWADVTKQKESGLLKIAALPDNPSEEDIAAYRKSWGVPDKPEGYDIKVPDGLDFGDADKKSLDGFVSDMHAANVPKAIVQKVADSYFKIRAQEEQALYDSAIEKTTNQRVEIKTEYGRDYDRNVKLANADLVQMLGAENAQRLAAITQDDGTKLGDNPLFVKYIVQSAMRVSDDDMLVSSNLGLGGKSVDDRIGELRNLQFGSDQQRRQFHSPEVQAEYMRLYENKVRMNGARAG